ncbi:MAG TPA: nuclear transport factor 2 family protein [Candidatus Acidoferrum sp.]|nr:nuclear transport factor 2 family protein [Candidatus Acidoferrum sp.]
MKAKILLAASLLVAAAAISVWGQNSSDEAGHIQALELAWNHALESKDANALDMLLANTMVSVDIDGSMVNKKDFLASVKSPEYQPSQAVTEQSNVQMYGDAAVVVGIFRIKGMEKGKPYVHRERFVDTWVKISGRWQCVATTSALITGKQPAD